MDTVEGPPRPGVGVFRKLLHLVDADARRVVFRGVPLYTARCGAMVAVGDNLRPWEWCPACAPSRAVRAA